MDFWVLKGKSSVVAVWFMNSKLFLSKQGVPIGARESIQTNIFVVTRFQREALSWCFSMNDSILFFLIYKGRSWLVWIVVIVFATYILENQISNMISIRLDYFPPSSVQFPAWPACFGWKRFNSYADEMNVCSLLSPSAKFLPLQCSPPDAMLGGKKKRNILVQHRFCAPDSLVGKVCTEQVLDDDSVILFWATISF